MHRLPTTARWPGEPERLRRSTLPTNPSSAGTVPRRSARPSNLPTSSTEGVTSNSCISARPQKPMMDRLQPSPAGKQPSLAAEAITRPWSCSPPPSRRPIGGVSLDLLLEVSLKRVSREISDDWKPQGSPNHCITEWNRAGHPETPTPTQFFRPSPGAVTPVTPVTSLGGFKSCPV